MEYLFKPFIDAMNEIGEHGFKKHPNPIKFSISDRSRPEGGRWSAEAIALHAETHFDEYLWNIKHDHFGTREHQLAAVAFNAMMEYYFYKVESR